jgi:Dienelactone hydrolase family
MNLVPWLIVLTLILPQAGVTPVNQQAATTADTTALTPQQWQELADAQWRAKAAELREELQRELDQAAIELNGKSMKLLVKEFGPPLQSGSALYISMHGGGGAPKEVNDQQWRNQIKLYQPNEGYYVAPRAPTDSWNLWHEAHMDGLLDRLILAFVVCKGVDPNRVYLMGYSAGGDGVYQLAPRMSDRWAACAMMAGHPNETRAEGLRNVPFALFMGGKDSAYNRNNIAKQWEEKLAQLAKDDPGGYVNLVRIYPESGHWMNLQDREALPWMQEKTRQPWPKKVVWVQDDVGHRRLYWLGVENNVPAGTTIEGEIVQQAIAIKSDQPAVILYLHDSLINLEQPIQVKFNEQLVFEGTVKRSANAITQSLSQRYDKPLIAAAILKVEKP